jgi:hypothetical protein
MSIGEIQLKYWNTHFLFSVHQQSSYQTNTHTHTHTQTDSGGREGITERKKKKNRRHKKRKSSSIFFIILMINL